ncbi:MAG: LuxR C-terminal-related transcriptional regulator [Planctomycetia bacterium]
MSQRPPAASDFERLLRDAVDADVERGLVLLGQDRRVLYANGTARMVLGLPGASSSSAEVRLPDLLDMRLAALLDRARTTRAAQEQEVDWPSADERVAHIVIEVRRRGTGWVGVLRSMRAPGRVEASVRALQARWPLTLREAQVAEGVARGLANSEVAASLGIVEKTVKNVLMSVYAKVGVRNRVELALRAHGLEVPRR